jgi:hypothetical protein
VLYDGAVVLGKFALDVFDSIAIINYSVEFVTNLYKKSELMTHAILLSRWQRNGSNFVVLPARAMWLKEH